MNSDWKRAFKQQLFEQFSRLGKALASGSRIELLDLLSQTGRTVEEFAAGHIPGALSIPVKELPRRLAELPRRQQIVAYCRGPYCVQSDEAVSLLKRRGFDARRLEVGLPDWRANGLPVATAEKQPQRRQRFSRALITSRRLQRASKSAGA